MKKTIEMKVSFVLPPRVTPREAVAYTKEAVKGWCGSLQPPESDNGDGTVSDGDPMFDLDQQTVRVQLTAARVVP